jgi:TMEM175 potassium channel family protein
MTTSRLEAFSDAVLAIIITIMVLELHVPHEPTLHALAESATGLLTYLLSFVYLGIYWNNHHHLFQLVGRVRGGVLWANLHLLFWLSLVPFTTAWMDEHFGTTPVMVYGVNLTLAALAYLLLQLTVERADGPDSALRQALGRDLKGKISPLIYLFGIIGTLLWVWVGIAAYVLVALIWLLPDRRMEHYIDANTEPPTLRP